MQIQIGRVTHYYNRIGVAVIELTKDLTIGETVLFLGHTTDFSQLVTSMEVDHQKVQTVAPGTDLALKVIQPVRKGDIVYKVMEPDAISPGTDIA